MFPMHPDHEMVIVRQRRRELERAAETWRLVRQALDATERNSRFVQLPAAGPTTVLGAAVEPHGMGPLMQLQKWRGRRSRQALVRVPSDHTNPDEGEPRCLPPQSCQPSLTSR